MPWASRCGDQSLPRLPVVIRRRSILQGKPQVDPRNDLHRHPGNAYPITQPEIRYREKSLTQFAWQSFRWMIVEL